jgi:hypothetical protein
LLSEPRLAGINAVSSAIAGALQAAAAATRVSPAASEQSRRPEKYL